MFFNKVNRELEREVERLEQLTKAQTVAYDELVAYYDKKRKELESESRDQSVSIDFRAMNAFSVERIVRDNEPITIIGYSLQKKSEGSYSTEVKEWYLHCNDRVHNDVVKQFKEYMENRKQVF
jgi:hypothetical protein